jgi:hypothetical protein
LIWLAIASVALAAWLAGDLTSEATTVKQFRAGAMLAADH